MEPPKKKSAEEKVSWFCAPNIRKFFGEWQQNVQEKSSHHSTGA